MDFSHQTILTNQYFIYICTMKERKQTLGFFLARATYGMAASLNGLLKNKGVDLTHSQYEVLRVLYAEDGISQQELAKRVYKDVSAIKRTLDILEGKGLVQRVPVTMRKNSIIITETGKQLIPQVLDYIERWEHSLLKGVDSEEYEIFKNVLKNIHENLALGLHDSKPI